MSEDMPATYARRVGERLRDVRRQQRLSLQGVEAGSGQEFRASVLGAYERGERAISVPRLQRLAKFYNVPVDQLLPRDTGAEPAWAAGGDEPERIAASVTIDLSRLDALESPEAELLSRYVASLQVMRQDFNGRVLSIREDDVRAIACMFGTDSQQMLRRLDDLGVVR